MSRFEIFIFVFDYEFLKGRKRRAGRIKSVALRKPNFKCMR